MWETIGTIFIAIIAIIAFIIIAGLTDFTGSVFDFSLDDNERKKHPVIWTSKLILIFSFIALALYFVIRNN